MTQETLQAAEEQMEKTIEATGEDFASVRTGRANPGLYSKVMVEYYGSFTPLQQLAAIIAGPPSGTCSSPVYSSVKSRRKMACRSVRMAR